MSDDFVNEIINFIGNTVEITEHERKEVMRGIVRDVIGNNPKKTGLSVRNWQGAKDTIPTGIIPYADGGAGAAAATAAFEANATAFGTDGTWYFVNNIHYTYYLEYGSSQQAANGMARVAAKNAADDLRARFG